MSTVRKFTFDLNFDDGQAGGRDPHAHQTGRTPEPEPEPEEIVEPEPEPEPEAPTFSEEELNLAREDAYVAGHAAALEEAAVVQGRELADAVKAVAAQLPDLDARVKAANAEVNELAARVAIDICRKMLPHCPEDYAAQEVSALVNALLPSLIEQPRLLVRVSPRLAAPVRRVLQDLPERTGFDGRLIVLEDAAMGDGDARLEWPDGGAERNSTRLWEDIDALVERNLPRFSRGEALDLPDPEGDDDDAWTEDDVWPEIDSSAYWRPTAAPDLPQPEPDAPPEQAADIEADAALDAGAVPDEGAEDIHELQDETTWDMEAETAAPPAPDEPPPDPDEPPPTAQADDAPAQPADRRA